MPHGACSRLEPKPKFSPAKRKRRALIAWRVQLEIRIRFFAGQVAPVVEQHSAEALARQRLQKLFGNHLVGVNVYAIQCRDKTSVLKECLHSILLVRGVEIAR